MASAIAILVVCSVLVGWTLNIDVPKRVLPGLVAMNPAAALAFILAGVSLLLARAQGRDSTLDRIAQGLAFAVTLVGLFTLIGMLFGWDVGLDQLLFREKLESEAAVTGTPNRMAPNTALNFFLLGCPLLLLNRPTRRGYWPAQYLSLVVVAASLLTIVGYAYGVEYLYGVASYIPMALHTGLTFLVLAVGLLCARPDRGPMAIVTSDSAGGVMARRLLPAAILVPAVLGWFRLKGEQARLYDAALGVAFIVVANTIIFVLMIVWSVRSLHRTDTEREQYEEELRKSEERTRAVVETASDAIITMTANGLIRSCNPGAERIFGYSAEEATGQPLRMLMPERFRRSHEEGFRRYLKTGEARVVGKGPIELTGLRKSGEEFPLELSLGEMCEDDNILFTGIVRDVTERKQAEEELREAEERLRHMFDDAAIGMAVNEFDGRFTQVNSSLCEMLGYSEEELLSTTFRDITHPEDLDTSAEHLQRLLEGETDSYQLEKRYVHAGGHPVWVLLNVSLVRDSKEHPLYLIAQSQDITGRKKAEERLRWAYDELELRVQQRTSQLTEANEKLREKEARYRGVFDSNVIGIFFWNTEGDILRANDAFLDILGYTREDLHQNGLNWRTITPEEYRPLDDERLGDVLASGATEPFEKEYIRKDGSRVSVLVGMALLEEYRDRGVCFALDLTEREREEERRKSEERFRLMVESAEDYAILMLDPEGCVSSWNQGAERIKGYTEEEIVGQHFSRFYTEEDIERDWPGHDLRVAASEGQFENEGWRVRKDGSRFWASVVITALRDEAGELRGFSKVTRDITERKQAEERIRQQVDLLDLSYEPIFVWELDGSITYWNRGCEELYGFSKEAAVGRTSHELLRTVHPMPPEQFRAVLQREGQWVGELHHTTRAGRQVTVESRHTLMRASDGRQLILETNRDLTERKRNEDALRFLAEASEVLTSSLDYRATLERVARLAVPYLADWCAIDILGEKEDGSLERLAGAHQDPEKVAWAHELQERYPSDPESPQGVTNVLRTGRSEVYPEITDEVLAAAARDPEHLELMRRIGFKSAIIVPLVARGRTLGTITLVSAESERRYEEADPSLAEDLARRAALAVDNARLTARPGRRSPSASGPKKSWPSWWRSSRARTGSSSSSPT